LSGLYDNLVVWYRSKSLGFHWGVLIALIILVVLEAVDFIIEPPGWPDITGRTGSEIPGYRQYTPVMWVVGLATGLMTGFACRYSKIYDMTGRATGVVNQVEGLVLKPWVQSFLGIITVIALVAEFYGLATGSFTISERTRNAAIHVGGLYWLGGILTSGLVGSVVDMKALPQVIKLMLVIWIAVLAHIFWWITP
jgi:hypothetical protein